MGVTKTSEFSAQHNELANIAKAIGHPARIAILEQLIKSNTCICNDFVLALPLAQATISQHLRELKQVGLIQGEVEGTSVCYCINPKTWKRFEKLMNGLFQEIKTKCC